MSFQPHHAVRMMDERPDLRAPGASQPAPATADRQRAVGFARHALKFSGALNVTDEQVCLLARELLRALALSE